MKKKFTVLICVILLLQVVLTACGTTPNDPSSSTVLPDNDISAATSDVSLGDNTTSAADTDGTTTNGTTRSNTSASSTRQSTTKKPSTTTTTATQKEETALAKDILSYLTANPNVTKVSEYNPTSREWSNIEAITFDGASMNGQKTKVFAYIGFPENVPAGKKVPAMVLVHGGGGHAYAEWVKKWTDKGYAAIAMDTTGFFPSETGKGVAGKEGEAASLWKYGLYGPFAESGYTDTPLSGGMKTDAMNAMGDHQRQWMYHAVVSTIMAHNILKADSRVNTNKIGITGISWGGVITSIAIGYDTRYAFAIPVYGSGYLDESLTYFYTAFASEIVKDTWSAADRFDKVDFPTLWLAWVTDSNFSINTNSKSYLAVKKAGGILSIKQDWGHSHRSGFAPEEIYRFADSICRGGKKLVSCVTEPSGKNISFTIKKPTDATNVTAKAYYITEKLSYSLKGAATPTADQTKEDWKTVDCKVNGTTVTGTLPANAVNYYVEITLTTADGTYTTTTSLVEIGG